VVGGWWLVVSG
jgi:hypothetical protein